MRKFKLTILALVLLVVFHIAIRLPLSFVEIFPCQIAPVSFNMEAVEWEEGFCNGEMWFGSVQELTPIAFIVRMFLIYGLPVLLTSLIIHRLNLRMKRKNKIN